MKSKLFRLLARLFVPAWIEEMDREDIFRLHASKDVHVDEVDYVLVEDNQADVTVFAFSGLDGLFAAGPKFEFRKILGKLGRKCNLVFIRELRGFLYHRTPEGGFDGLPFYEARVREIMARLGARWNIAIGFSSGAVAAAYFGTRCGMQKAVSFSPGFPLSVYVGPRMQLRHWFDIRKLITKPRDYIDVSGVTIAILLVRHRLREVYGAGYELDVLGAYRDAGDMRPRLTIVYGAGCRQDTAQAELMLEFPQVKLVPVETGTHDVTGVLKRRGELGQLILREIEEMVGEERR